MYIFFNDFNIKFNNVFILIIIIKKVNTRM